MAVNLFDELKLPRDSYECQVNSIGCPECRKIYQNALREYYAQFAEKLCSDCTSRLERNPMRLLDCKVPSCGEFKDGAPLILNFNCESCSDFFAKFKSALDLLTIPYTVNAKIVRGLDYYCNTVFEFVSKSGLVFGGGGRYNGLMKELGGADTPASGFAIGIERLVSLTETHLPCPVLPDIYIGSMGEKAAESALKLAQDLRGACCNAHCDITGRSVKAQMRFADKIGARYSLIIGESELERGSATLKNMESKEANEVGLNAGEIAEFLQGAGK
jgi:histidyl-tRNA synthetase